MSKTMFAARTGNRTHISEEKRLREKIGIYSIMMRTRSTQYAVSGVQILVADSVKLRMH